LGRYKVNIDSVRGQKEDPEEKQQEKEHEEELKDAKHIIDQLKELHIDKNFILRMSRRQIMEESENPSELPYYIKLPYLYPEKLKSEEFVVIIGSCNAIF